MNANITNIQIFDDMKFDPLITLTYILMDNFCPSFKWKILDQLFIKNVSSSTSHKKTPSLRPYVFE